MMGVKAAKIGHQPCGHCIMPYPVRGSKTMHGTETVEIQSKNRNSRLCCCCFDIWGRGYIPEPRVGLLSVE
jgi:hypothetical protein